MQRDRVVDLRLDLSLKQIRLEFISPLGHDDVVVEDAFAPWRFDGKGDDAFEGACVIRSYLPHSHGVIIEVLELDVRDRRLDRIEAGGAYAAKVDPIGERSARALVDPSTGATLTFAHGGTLITLQVPAASDGATLLDDAQLLALAEMVASRL